MVNAPRRFLNVKQAADYLGISESTLNKQRCFGGGPVYLKLGARVQYDVEDLDAYAASSRRRSTSENAAA